MLFAAPMRDPYEVLGVDRSATQDELKSAFRKLAAQHHPDKNGGDEGAQQRFKEINAAFQILSDPDKRAAFDRFGAGGIGGSGPFPGGVPFDLSDLKIDGIFGDLLDALGFKVGDRGHLQRELKITFEEAVFGCTKDVVYERVEGCSDCRGSGAVAGSALERCSACQGRGRVRIQQGMFPIAIERACTRCRGTGQIVVDPCAACRGAGLVSKQRTISVTVPPGIENGATRTVERGGNAVRGDRSPGALEITIRVASHAFFRRAGDDVTCQLPVTFAQAALGAEVEIPTLDGKGKLKVPAGTQPGTVLRLRGKGIPRRVMSGRGDQMVEITIEVPTSLTLAQRELIEQLAAELGESVQPQRTSFVERLKALFG